jgi:hypothetical protein
MLSSEACKRTVVPEAVRGFDLEDTRSAGMTNFEKLTGEGQGEKG